MIVDAFAFIDPFNVKLYQLIEIDIIIDVSLRKMDVVCGKYAFTINFIPDTSDWGHCNKGNTLLGSGNFVEFV